MCVPSCGIISSEQWTSTWNVKMPLDHQSSPLSILYETISILSPSFLCCWNCKEDFHCTKISKVNGKKVYSSLSCLHLMLPCYQSPTLHQTHIRQDRGAGRRQHVKQSNLWESQLSNTGLGPPLWWFHRSQEDYLCVEEDDCKMNCHMAGCWTWLILDEVIICSGPEGLPQGLPWGSSSNKMSLRIKSLVPTPK